MDKRQKMAIDAAKLYYLSDCSQSEIASVLGVSRPTVSKLLTYAKEEGFARVEIQDPRSESEQLSRLLTKRFGLKSAKVVWPKSGDPLAAVGEAGAELLQVMVHDGDSIGVTSGHTLYTVGKHLQNGDWSNVEIVQLKGGIGLSNFGESDWNTLAMFRDAFNAEMVLLPLPAVFKNAKAKVLVANEPEIARIIEKISQVDIAVFTVGVASENSQLLEQGHYSQNDREWVLGRAIGHICSHWVDAQGRICCPEIDERTVGISLGGLKKIPRRVLVARGMEKVKIISTALNRGIVTDFVTDRLTAEAVLKFT